VVILRESQSAKLVPTQIKPHATGRLTGPKLTELNLSLRPQRAVKLPMSNFNLFAFLCRVMNQRVKGRRGRGLSICFWHKADVAIAFSDVRFRG
jgi:hypothetical protein